MDDIYIIDRDRKYIEETFAGIVKQVETLGLFINGRKTRIYRLSDTFKYLQVKYFLTKTGKVVRRINPKSLARERRRLKSYKHLLDERRMQYPAIEEAYKSWMGDFHRMMSRKQIEHMKELYKQLFGKEPRWKK